MKLELKKCALKRLAVLVFSLLLLFINANGQLDPQPAFSNLTTDDGLASSEVYEVHEDAKGYLWFSTDNGVSRYDGYEFKNFGAEDGLTCNVIFHFFEDHTGRLWMNSLTGEFFYHENDRFYPYEFNHIIQEYQEKYWGVGQFFFDHERTLYFKMNSIGILKIDSLGNHTLYGDDVYGGTILETSLGVLSTVVYNSPHIAQVDSINQKLHTEDRIGTIQILSDQKKHKILFPFGVNEGSKTIKLVTIGPNEYLFLFGLDLLHIKDSVIKWKQNKGIPRFVPCLKQMKDGTIFFSYENGKGIRRYKNLENLKRGIFEVWLDDIIISDVFIDSKGGYWFTTIGNGIYYIPSLSIKVFDENSGLKSRNISTFAIENDQSIFIADQEGEFYSLDHKNNQIQQLPKSDQDVPIISLFYDEKTNFLWSGAPPLKYFDGTRWNEVITNSKVKRAIRRFLINIKPSNDLESLWGCGSFGFASVDLNSNRLKVLSNDLQDLKRTRTFVVYENSKKQVFVSNLNGFFELRKDSLVKVNEEYPSFRLRIEDIVEDQSGNLILGTKGAGVLIWNGDKILDIGKKEGLLSNMIEHVEVDDNNNIWVATLNGLNLINRQNFKGERPKVLSYTKAHGLPSNEITYLKSKGDTIWLATPKGLVLFPQQKVFSCQNNHVFLENFVVNDEVIHSETGYKFAYNENNVRIEYLSINVKLQGKIQYRYRLNNQLKWRYTFERSANFIDLSPGRYHFEVQAKDENEEWTPSLKVEFLIKKPVWETTWFLLLILILIASLIWMAINRYVERIKRDNEIEKEMYILKASALQAQMNPHFVFNCLNAIQSFIAKQQTDKATRYLAKFALLVRSNLNASVNKVVTLDEELQTIENYLSFEKMRFQKKLNYTINVDSDLDIYEIEIPPLLTLPYVENAIIHGMLQSPRPGELKINYLKDQDNLIIEIIDNGIGIFQAQKIKKESQLEGIHKSVGMSISKKMLEIFNDGIREEDLIIEELKGAENEILGTKVKLRIKIK